MKVKIDERGPQLKHYVCDITIELDRLSGLDKLTKEEYYYSHHYALSDEFYRKRKCMAIRLPGRTVGGLYYDDDFKITEIEIYTDYDYIARIYKLHTDNVNEELQKFIGTKIEIEE